MPKEEKRRPHALYGFEPTKTKQSFKQECDINEILKRAKNGQDISKLVNNRVARYGDFTNVPDYRDALDMVNRAEGMFMQLDAKVRERFNNDPGRMISFLQDPANRDEAIKLGLVNPPLKVDEPVPAVPAPEPKGPKGPAEGNKSPEGESAPNPS